MSESQLITEPQRSQGELSLSTLGTLMSAAIDKGLAPEALEKLVDLQERLMKQQAIAAFNQAIQMFQSRCPTIVHNRPVSAGSFTYTFADLPQIRKVIQPLLDECQLTYSFDTEFTEERIRVTCKVKHVLGHSEESSFEAKICGTDKMSSIQKSASTVTYGKRYALVGALGLMTATEDTDGRTGQEPHKNPEHDEAAPRAKPRAQRQGPPADSDVVNTRRNLIRKVFVLWESEADKPERKAALAAASVDEKKTMYRNWVRIVSTHETIDPSKPHEWGEAEDAAFAACDLYFAEPA